MVLLSFPVLLCDNEMWIYCTKGLKSTYETWYVHFQLKLLDTDPTYHVSACLYRSTYAWYSLPYSFQEFPKPARPTILLQQHSLPSVGQYHNLPMAHSRHSSLMDKNTVSEITSSASKEKPYVLVRRLCQTLFIRVKWLRFM